MSNNTTLDSKSDINPLSESSIKTKERLNIQDRIKTIIRTVSGQFDIEVSTNIDEETRNSLIASGQDPENAWFISTKHDPITRKIISKNAHIPEQIFESHENIAKGKAAHEAGHVAISRYGEFVPIEVMQELGFPSLLAALEERATDQSIRKRLIGAGQWIDEARRVEVETPLNSEVQIDIPKFYQLAKLIVYKPHYTEIPKYYSKDVLDLYDEISEIITKQENTLPNENADEKEVKNKALSRYKIAYLDIWPKVKKLIEEDKQDSKDNKPLKNLDESDFEPEQESSADLEPNESDSSECRQKPSQETIERLEKLEKELVEKFSGKFNQDNKSIDIENEYDEIPESDVEEKKRKSEEQLKRELAEIEKRLQELQDNNTNIYDETYAQVRTHEMALYRELEEIFSPNIKPHTRLKSSGSRISLPAVFKWDAARKAGAKAVDSKIFEVIHIPEKKDYAISILVDLSGSMSQDDKIDEAFKAVVLLTETLNRLNLNFELKGFQNRVINFKNFDQKISESVRQKISGMILEVDDRNPGGNNVCGYNDDGPCLNETSNSLAKQSAKEKFLIVLSDGMPAGSYSDEDDLYEEVRRITQNTDQKLIALGLGNYTDHVEHFYPTSIANITVEDLSDVLSKLLKDIISNPEKYN